MKRFIRANFDRVPPNPYDIGPPEPKELPNDEYQETVNVEFDTIVIVDSSGLWDYEDESLDWAESEDGDDYYSQEDNIFLDDVTSVVEHVEELIISRMPATPGRYKIHVEASLVYNISGVQFEREYVEEPDGMPDYDETRYTDYAEAEYNKNESKLDKFEFEKL